MRRRHRTLRWTGLMAATCAVMLAAGVTTASGAATGSGAAGAASSAPPVRSAGSGGTGPGYTWPTFHYDSALSGVSPDPAVSTTTASSLGVRWMADTGAQVLSSPMAAHNAALGGTLVFVGNEAGYMTAYDQSDGVPVWSDDLGSAIRSSPLADGAYVWVEPTRSYRLYKLDAATGAVVCSAPTPDTENVDSSPILATPPGGSPTVYIGNNDVGTMNGPLTAVDEATCAVDFQVSPEPVRGSGGIWDPISYGVTAAGEGLVLFGTADPDSGVYAVDAVTGALVWRYAVYNPPPGTYDVGAGITVSPPGANGFAGGVAYVASKYGIMYALSLSTGALIWQYDFGARSGIVPPGALSTAALVGRQLVFGNGGGVTSLDAVTGALQWRHPVGNTLDVDSSPAVTGPPGAQVVSFTTQTGEFDVVSLAAGTLLYHYQTANYMVTSPADANGSLIATSGDGYLYDFASGGGNGPAPTTSVASPSEGATVPYPGPSVTLTGTAADPAAPVSAVTVAVQRDGAQGQWWDAASGSWVASPYPDPAVLSAPGSTATHWSLVVPVSSQGGSYQVFASAVDDTGVADVSAEQSAATGARVAFSIQASPPPDITLSAPTAALQQTLAVSGTGFGAGEHVGITLSGTTLADAVATASGTLPMTEITVPRTEPFGPETVIATGASSGLATSAPLYVSDPWAQLLAGPTHSGADVGNEVFNQHLSVSPQTYLSEAWSFNTGAAVTGSASVVGGVAYVGNAAGDVDAVRVQTGTQLWTRVLAGAPVDSTPAVDGGVVFVGTGAGRVVALDAATGARRWAATVSAGSGLSSPTVAGGSVYVASRAGTVYALNEASGAAEWHRHLAGPTPAAPAVDPAAGTLVIGDDTGTVTALDAATGARRWSYLAGGAVTASAMIDLGDVYVGSADGNAYALSEATGSPVWTTATGGPILAAPVLAAGAPSIAVGSQGATYYLNPRTGALVYRVAMDAPVAGVGGAIGFVVTVEADGRIVGSKPQATDPYAWQVQLAGSFASAPTVVDDAVYVTGRSGVVTCYSVPGLPPQ